MLLPLCAVMARAQPSAAVVLGPKLVEWRKEIEATGRTKVILARVYRDRKHDLVYLPKDAGQRPILVRYFHNEHFLRQFIKMDAVTINYYGEEGTFSFILLNMDRSEDWDFDEDAVLAHEFGHAWLFANDYVAPVFEGKQDSCISIYAGEAVQHILIRKEIARRGIPDLDYRLRSLEKTLDHLQRDDAPAFEQLSVCEKMAPIVPWLDVRLGLSPELWNHYDRFQKVMEQRFPVLKQFTRDLYRKLRVAKLDTPKNYQRTLEDVLYMMYGFAEQVLGWKRPKPNAPPSVAVTPMVIQPGDLPPEEKP